MKIETSNGNQNMSARLPSLISGGVGRDCLRCSRARFSESREKALPAILRNLSYLAAVSAVMFPPAAAGATSSSFDLSCVVTKSEKTRSEDFRETNRPPEVQIGATYRFKFQLDKNMWCDSVCAAPAPITAIDDRYIYIGLYSPPPAFDDVRSSLYAVWTRIDRYTLVYDHFWNQLIHGNGGTVSIEASCKKLPFTGMPQRQS
jgi:hypothetical protein